MPVKDLSGPPRPTAAERALHAEILRHVEHLRRDDDGLEPVPASPGPTPSPPTAAAAAATDDG